MRLSQLTIDRLTDLKGLMLNFPEDAELDMTKWRPTCSTACCAAGNAVIYLKSWSDHLEFDDSGIGFINDDVVINTKRILRRFLLGINVLEFDNIFVYPETTKQVAAAITRVLED